MNQNQNDGCATLAGLAFAVVPILLLCTAFLIVYQYTANMLLLIAGTILLAWLIGMAIATLATCAFIAWVFISDKF